jgi:hypothetical protein
MPLTEKEYSDKLSTILQLTWDLDKFRLGIQCRTTNPNPYCEKELDEAIDSMKKLLIQFKTHNIDDSGKDLNGDDRWWLPDIVKNSEAQLV